MTRDRPNWTEPTGPCPFPYCSGDPTRGLNGSVYVLVVFGSVSRTWNDSGKWVLRRCHPRCRDQAKLDDWALRPLEGTV